MYQLTLVKSTLLSPVQAQLRSQLASLRAALANKEAEVQRLRQALDVKDRTIGELQEQLARGEEEKEREAERAGDLQREKSALQVYYTVYTAQRESIKTLKSIIVVFSFTKYTCPLYNC